MAAGQNGLSQGSRIGMRPRSRRAEPRRGWATALDSPATDPLGRSGLDGEVDRHFWQRFGGALL
ncbi:hypothetical protein GBZ48_35065, partial [Azospirillum melinis]|nr:hypothetical protein [Azospirillum melinis]